jgi:hypothetical protein
MGAMRSSDDGLAGRDLELDLYLRDRLGGVCV